MGFEPIDASPAAKAKADLINRFDTQFPSIPGKARVEALISEREPLFEKARSFDAERESGIAGEIGQKALQVGAAALTPFERVAAAGSNIALRAQEDIGAVSPVTADLDKPDPTVNVPALGGPASFGGKLAETGVVSEATKGITGERLGFPGDPGRAMNFPEPFNIASDILLSIGADRFITGGRILGRLAIQGFRAQKSTTKMIAQINKIDQHFNDLAKADDTGIGKAYDALRNIPLRGTDVEGIVQALPQRVANSIRRSPIIKKIGKEIDQTMDNLKVIANKIWQSLPSGVRSGAKEFNEEEAALRSAYFRVRESMLKEADAVGLAGNLKESWEKYKEFKTLQGVIMSISHKTLGGRSIPDPAKLLKAMKNTTGGEAPFLEALGRGWREGAEILRQLKIHNIRGNIGSLARKAATFSGAAGIASIPIRSIVREAAGAPPVVSGGGSG